MNLIIMHNLTTEYIIKKRMVAIVMKVELPLMEAEKRLYMNLS